MISDISVPFPPFLRSPFGWGNIWVSQKIVLNPFPYNFATESETLQSVFGEGALAV